MRKAAGDELARVRPNWSNSPQNIRAKPGRRRITTFASIRSASKRAIALRRVCGDIFHLAGSYTQDWLLKPTDYNWRVLGSEGGELRAIADIGTHWLDLAHSITSLEVESVCSALKTVHPVRQRPKGEVETFQSKIKTEIETIPVNIDTEDCGAILLRMKNGSIGVLHVSQVNAGRKNCLRIEISGAKESFAWNSESPNDLWIGHRDKPNESLVRDPALLSPLAAPPPTTPAATTKVFQIPSSNVFGRSTVTSPPATSQRRSRTRPSPTATARFCSAKRF